MPTTTDFTTQAMMRRVPRELRQHVKAAKEMGWTGRTSGSGGLILYSPDGEHRVTIPITIGDSHTVKNVAREILRWTPDTVAFDAADEAVNTRNEGLVQSLGTLVIEAGGAFGSAVSAGLPQQQRPPVHVCLLTHSHDAHDWVYTSSGGGHMMDTWDDTGVERNQKWWHCPGISEPEAAPGPEATPERTLLSIQPWMAKVHTNPDGTADLYQSQSVQERHWSDGSVDFQCTICDYDAAKPYSVSAHTRKHTLRGEKAPARQDPTEFDVPMPPSPPRRKPASRIAALAREIEAALRVTPWEGGDDWASFAHALAEGIVAKRVEAGIVERDTEPLTDADLLARLRTLLLRDDQRRAEPALVEAAALKDQVAELVAQVAAAQATTQRYKDTLASLAALAKEEGEG